ncbi:MAG: hypothetical protein MUP66_00495 [Candidatus Nanohaloarchaeota archaeon QJJ-5]|nr:hypothetical protein [Candidatus Nanohaloarchaeota archaeon QJJ-5]
MPLPRIESLHEEVGDYLSTITSSRALDKIQESELRYADPEAEIGPYKHVERTEDPWLTVSGEEEGGFPAVSVYDVDDELLVEYEPHASVGLFYTMEEAGMNPLIDFIRSEEALPDGAWLDELYR